MDSATRRLWQINKYSWMSLAGVLVYIFTAQAQHLFIVPVGVAWALFALGAIECLGRSVVGYRHGGSLQGGWSTFFNAAEIGLIALSIVITGGIRSDLWMLYFVVMTYESLYSDPRAKRLLDLYISIVYLLATLPVQLWLPHPEPEATYWRLLLTRLFALILVSALARRISTDAHQRDLELMILREEMATSEERSRIAREIHDGLGHAMVSAILRLELCLRLLRKNRNDEAEQLLQEEIPALRTAWNEGRDMAFHLRPWETNANAAPKSLADALQNHIDRFAERTGINMALHVEGIEISLRPGVAYGLTRIVQEALTNAARHAHCSTATVTVIYTPDGRVTCVIVDDGQGFDADRAVTGVGLQAMRERASKLGGSLTVASAPGQGTSVTACLPGLK
jgi:signal transduction histidine kinase